MTEKRVITFNGAEIATALVNEVQRRLSLPDGTPVDVDLNYDHGRADSLFLATVTVNISAEADKP